MNDKGLDIIAYIFESHRPWIDKLINYSLSRYARDSAIASTVANNAIVKMIKGK